MRIDFGRRKMTLIFENLYFSGDYVCFPLYYLHFVYTTQELVQLVKVESGMKTKMEHTKFKLFQRNNKKYQVGSTPSVP